MSDNDPGQLRPFAAYLTETNTGKTHRELSQQLHDLVEAVLHTGKDGTLTLTVKVGADDVDNRRLVITEVVTVKLPRPDARKSVFWANDDGNLVRTDPSQLSFGDLRAADTIPDERQAR